MAHRPIAYRIHHHPGKNRWYLDASWKRTVPAVASLDVLRSGEVIGVDMNADHLAAWRLDNSGNPVGRPRTFAYDLAGAASRRDAQVRHALARLLRWAVSSGVHVIAVEDLDFTDSKTREQHGRRRRFRQLISGLPTSKLRARLLAMTTEAGIAVIAVDPAYTSRWGAQHWQRPTSTTTRKTTRHEAAAIAIGRRALGYQLRRRAAPPGQHQMDAVRHRTVQAGSGTSGHEETRRPGPGPGTRFLPPAVGTKVGTQATQHRSGPPIDRDDPD
ncbi:hypothetical protein [Kribbella sp. NPDC004875]|uniref:hypothetical protein n=1 Tax=Kribbella sp. NPDC004875 TaxID=3364107 RepID=UPI00369B8A8E